MRAVVAKQPHFFALLCVIFSVLFRVRDEG